MHSRPSEASLNEHYPSQTHCLLIYFFSFGRNIYQYLAWICLLSSYTRMWASLVAQWWRIHLQCRRHGFDPWFSKISWWRKWYPTPVSLPRKSHGQRNLAGYSRWTCKELDTTEGLNNTTRMEASWKEEFFSIYSLNRTVSSTQYTLNECLLNNWINTGNNSCDFNFFQLDLLYKIVSS